MGRLHRLTQATGSGGTATYTYDGDGLKLRRVGPDDTTNYYYDGIQPIWETDTAGAMKAQYDRDIFGNLLSRLEPGSVRRYYHHDGLGSTTALTNSTGGIVATMLYDAWGNIRTNSGSGHGNYRYTGSERDPTTSLYHMGARFYDPVIGRWLSEDPVRDKPFEPATLNLYSYVANNPLILADPSGLQAETLEGGGSTSDDAQSKAQRIIEEIARILGLTREAVIQLISDFKAWANQNSSSLGPAGSWIGAIAAYLGLVAAASQGGFLTPAGAKAIGVVSQFGSSVSAAAAALGAYSAMKEGRISREAFGALVGASLGTALISPYAAGRIAEQPSSYSTGQALYLGGFVLALGWGLLGPMLSLLRWP